MIRVLITGITGYISQFLIDNCPENIQLTGTCRDRKKLQNMCLPEQIEVRNLDLSKNVNEQLLKLPAIDIIIHNAALSSLGYCEQNPALANQVNHLATADLAHWAAQKNIRFIYLSTDIVFRGDQAPYLEEDLPDPVNIYGKTKWLGEKATIAGTENHAIIRIALALGKGRRGTSNFVDWMMGRIANNQPLTLFKDEMRTPSATDPLADLIWKIALSGQQGIFHAAGKERLDRFELGYKICQHLNTGYHLLQAISLNDRDDYPRPVDVSLQTHKGTADQRFTLGTISEYLPLILA